MEPMIQQKPRFQAAIAGSLSTAERSLYIEVSSNNIPSKQSLASYLTQTSQKKQVALKFQASKRSDVLKIC